MLRLIGSLLLPELDTLRVVEMDNWGIRACRHLGASGARRFSIRRGQPLWS